MSEIDVKLYNESMGEIRHFAAPKSIDYREFEELVRELAGCDNFRMFAKDIEGDSVLVGSDREFQCVIWQKDRTNDKFLRIHLRSAKNPSQMYKNKTVHVDVSCSDCKGKVVGTRYKCLECRNYDLCEECMGNGKHCEHDMLAARSPQSHQLMKLLTRGQGSLESSIQPFTLEFISNLVDDPVSGNGKNMVADADNKRDQHIHELIGCMSKDLVEAITSLKNRVQGLTEVLGTEKKNQAKEQKETPHDYEKGNAVCTRGALETEAAKELQSVASSQTLHLMFTEKEMNDGFLILQMSGTTEDWALRDICAKFNGDTSRVLRFLDLISRLKTLDLDKGYNLAMANLQAGKI